MEWRLTLKQIAAACGGTLKNCAEDEIVKSVSKDSRSVSDGTVFVALKGTHTNGHRFIRQAVESGAVCCVAERGGDYGNMPVLEVDDCTAALGAIAAAYRDCFDISVVAVTGSVGKTSTKDMIASVLCQKFKTHKTRGNFNNEIGLPLTVFDLTSEDDIMVLELGMSAFGEISRLTKIAQPDTAVITNIGHSHIENLGSRENIMKAKLEILEGLSPDGEVILNGDDDMLATLNGVLDCETVFYGIENDSCDISARNVKQYSDSTDFDINLDGKKWTVTINVPGIHHVYNALAAILVGIRYNVPMEKIVKGIKEFTPGAMRQNITELGRFTIIKDYYNASPESMRSGLDVLASATTGRKVAILGDMLEMGNFSRELHRDVGGEVFSHGVDCLVTIGENAKYIAEGAVESGFDVSETYVFESKAAAKEKLPEIIKDGDCILIKASRGMAFEEIDEFLSNV